MSNLDLDLDLAWNPNTPPETLDRLANDEDYGVRYGVAWNPNTPPETLDSLANDENYWVRESVAQNTNTSTETLERLADDENYWAVRRGVTNNPNTPQYILTYLKIKKFLNYYE